MTTTDLAKAMYRINKEAKMLRDLKRDLKYNEVTDEDMDLLEEHFPDPFDKYPYSVRDGHIGVLNEWDSWYIDEDDIWRDVYQDENYWSDSALEDNDTMTEEEKQEAREYSEAEEEEAYRLCYALDEAKNFSKFLIDLKMNEIYRAKNKALSSLILSGLAEVCGVHEFENGDIRRCYMIGGFTFHGEDIASEISDEEYETVTPLDEIASENVLAKDITFEDAMALVNDYNNNKAVYNAA